MKINMLMRLFNNNKRYFSSHSALLSQAIVDCLPNGMRVATIETGSPLACTSLFIEAGPRIENIWYNGMTHFIEHMAYQGFRDMSKDVLQNILIDNCATMTAVTNRDLQIFSAVTPAEYASQYVRILAKIITDLEFDQCEIEQQKQYMFCEATDRENNPKAVMSDYLHQTAFQETPLAQAVIGSSENIQRFDTNMVCCFMKEYYQPHRFVLASSGGISQSAIMNAACESFGNIVASDCCPVDYGPQRYTGSEIIYRNDSLPYAHIAIAVEAPGYDSPDYMPLLVASNLTGSWDRSQGGTDRHGSPLARAAATSKLCERFESFYIAYRDVGLWGVYFVGDPHYLDEMVINIQDQWMKLCNTLTYPDVERAINLTKLKLAQNVDGAIKSCYDIGTQIIYTSTYKSINERMCDACRVTDAVIKDVGHKYIYDRCPAVAAVGPTEALPEYNRIRAGMYWLRL